MANISVIPKDCFVCDSCNKACSNAQFIATEKCFWWEGWLYCDECNEKYDPGQYKDSKLIMKIKIGDDLSNTELAQPIVMKFGGDEIFEQ